MPHAEGSAGIVKPQYFTFAEEGEGMLLEGGRHLGPITLAYETYGTLSPSRDNAVLIVHALSGDAHVTGLHDEGDSKPGWWDNMVGPGKGIDTDKYFVICSNVIGGCQGSTGPSSTNPKTGRAYALSFPMVTIGDMVTAQRELIDHLGIDRLLTVVGGSMGGMQVIEWTIRYPERVRSAIAISTTARLSPQSIAFNEVGRLAIMSDPNWKGGNYYGGNIPSRGLAVARMIGHITYLSEEAMERKFSRRMQERADYGFDFSAEFQVQSYLRHQGDSFIKRFDANSYLYITKAMDYYDPTRGKGSLLAALQGVKAKYLVVATSSDWLYPPSQSKELIRALKLNNIHATYSELHSDYGHDAFLVEAEPLAKTISGFLANTYATYK